MKQYKFEKWEAECVGDKYVYTVEAESREEAFNKLILYFFGEGGLKNQPVKSECYNISYPNHNFFGYSGMPYWFAKLISGNVREKYFNLFGKKREIDHGIIFKKHAEKHNLKIEERW